MPKNKPSTRTVPIIPRSAPYDHNAALAVCFFVATGKPMTESAQLAGLKNDVTLYQWLLDEPEFAKAYHDARSIKAHRMFDDILAEADRTDIGSDYVRIRVDTRKWAIGKLLPAIYGDNLKADINLTVSLEQLVVDSIKLRKDQDAGLIVDGPSFNGDGQKRQRARPGFGKGNARTATKIIDVEATDSGE